MPREMVLPFAIDPLGRVAFSEDPYEQAANRLEMLLGTPLRTRVMNPDYGVDTFGYVFAVNDEATLARLTSDIEDAASTWETQVVIRDVVPQSGEDDQLSVTVYFSLVGVSEGVDDLHTASIQIGGTVVSESGV
jgi:phage baseplate assembly protein W